MKKLVLVFSVVFLLATVCTIALADAVPGAVLYLDASDNPADPDAWTNLGTAGGELPASDKAPELETGTIEIPALDIVQKNVKYYTAEQGSQIFAANALAEPVLTLEDWTIEILCRRNGDLFSEEHELAGFLGQGYTIRPWIHPDGAIRLMLDSPAGGGQGIQKTGVILQEGAWTWVALVWNNGEQEFVAYQDGQQVGTAILGHKFDKDVFIDIITIGANSPGEKNRNFNGSIALFRIYDLALDEDEIMQNIDAWAGGLAVEPASKLTTAWGTVKTRY